MAKRKPPKNLSRSERQRRRKQQEQREQRMVRCVPTNANILFQRGPAIDVVWFIPKELEARLHKEGREVPEPVSGPILVDTGATFSAIAEETAKRLGLRPVDTRETAGVHGSQQSNVYHVGLRIPVGKNHAMDAVRQMIGVPDFERRSRKHGLMVNGTTGEPVGFTGLLGREFLRYATLIYDGAKGNLSIMIDPDFFRV